MRACSRCGKEKPLADFPADGYGGKRLACKRCTANEVQSAYHRNGGREKQHARRKALAAERYEKLEALKDQPCTDCGGRFPRVCMDFDHVRGDKVESVSRMIRMAFSWDLILAEIAKCELVCANCHRVRTAERAGYGQQRAV